MHKLVALLHYHNAVGVERDAALVAAGEHVLVLFAGDEQQRLIAHRALGVDAHQRAGVLAAVVLFLIEGNAVVVGNVALAALPDGDHAVDGLVFRHHAVIVFGLALVGLLAGLKALLMLNVHLDGPADIVGILLDKRLELPHLKIAAEDLLLGVLLDVHDNVCADCGLFNGGDGIAVGAAAFPLDALLLTVLSGDNGHMVRDHERGVEADAELADNAEILALGLLTVHLVLELVGAGLGDDAEIALALVHAHTDAVVAHGQGALRLIRDDVYSVIGTIEADLIVGQ